MLTPVITGYGGPAYRSDTLALIGSGFGRVTSAALVDMSGRQFECDFIVDRGTSVTITIPSLLPDGTYVPVLGTLDNIPSQSLAAPLVLPDPNAGVVPPRAVPEPLPDPASPACVAIRKRLRLELGDFEEPFQASVQGDGMTRRFDLPVEVIETVGLTVMTTAPGGNPVPVALADFQLNTQSGIITLSQPLPDDALLTVTGAHFQFFADAELDGFIRSAALKHTHTDSALQVYRDPNGFKHFLYADATVDTVAPVEYHLLALLAATEALEVIRTDGAYDINVTTAEGTSLPREDRFRNIGELIAAKQATYDSLASKLGVGIGRVEVFTLRRVSRTTGKLVPVYVDREYDDVRTPPIRVFAPRNTGVGGSGFAQPDPHSFFGNTP